MKQGFFLLLAFSFTVALAGCNTLGQQKLTQAAFDDGTVMLASGEGCGDQASGCSDAGCNEARCCSSSCSDGCCAISSSCQGCSSIPGGLLGELGIGNGQIAARIASRAYQNCANGHRGLAAGPSMGAVTYPYYTVRGPRDFLERNLNSIGP